MLAVACDMWLLFLVVAVDLLSDSYDLAANLITSGQV